MTTKTITSTTLSRETISMIEIRQRGDIIRFIYIENDVLSNHADFFTFHFHVNLNYTNEDIHTTMNNGDNKT